MSRLPEVERSAAAAFAAVPDLAWLVAAPTREGAEYLRLHRAGLILVAVDPADEPVGFVAGEPFGPELHLWELSVRADRQGLGIGRALMTAASTAARADGRTALTLTTFADVPWNAPFYARIGFRRLAGEEIDARLAAVLSAEAEHGLPAGRRCAMRLALS